MDIRDKIVSFISMRGPTLPIEVSKYIGKDLTLTSAVLADLTSSKRLRISSLKVGQSKLYFSPGQEIRLQSFVKYLNDKDRETVETLRKDLVLRDSEIRPLTRVSLRQVKDFAVALEVNHNGAKEIFWKWYLTKNDEATKIIRKMLGIRDEKLNPVKKEEAPVIKSESKPEKEAAISEPGKPEREKGSKTELKKDQKKDLKKEIKKEEKKEPEIKAKAPEPKVPVQKVLEISINDPFGQSVRRLFDLKGIKIKGYKIIRKKSEIDFEILIPSPAGDLPYYCKAKNKKRINDGDLATALVTGQMKKLPVLFVSPGTLTKKTQEKMGGEFSSLTLMEL